MFDKVKAVNKARKMQAEMKREMEKVFHKYESGDDYVLIRGDKKIEELVIEGESRKDIKDLINKGMKELDKKLEKQMRENSSVSDLMEMLGV